MQSNGTSHICTFSLSASNSGKVSLHIFSGFRFLILQLATFQSQIDWKKEIYFSGNKDFGTHIPLTFSKHNNTAATSSFSAQPSSFCQWI